MVRRVASSGAGVEVIVGKAGAGKTSALAAAAQAWRAGGVPVLGTAVAARAALAFGEQAGVPAMTITRLLAALDKPVGDRPAGLARGSVLIVDEAGMLGTRPLARLLAHIQAADAKLVLVGDHRQFPNSTPAAPSAASPAPSAPSSCRRTGGKPTLGNAPRSMSSASGR